MAAARRLEAFLAAKPTPIYIGFGSMPERDAARMTRLILEALRLSGQRCILLSGWAGLGSASLPDTVFHVESIPHAWLFKRVAAVVHHGGAGTSHAASRAGCPSIVVEHVTDQAFWGGVLHRAGIAPPMLHRRTVTAAKLARAIRATLGSPSMREKARAIGESMRNEDGVKRAVTLIEAQRWD